MRGILRELGSAMPPFGRNRVGERLGMCLGGGRYGWGCGMWDAEGDC